MGLCLLWQTAISACYLHTYCVHAYCLANKLSSFSLITQSATVIDRTVNSTRPATDVWTSHFGVSLVYAVQSAGKEYDIGPPIFV